MQLVIEDLYKIDFDPPDGAPLLLVQVSQIIMDHRVACLNVI
jgi:hypothetical protein